MMKITLLLLAIGSTAVGQITSEKPVTTPILTAAPGRQLQASVASDGNRFLAAWTDQRTYPQGLYAARVDENGALIDQTGIRLDVHPAEGSQPVVLFAGDTYSVFWNEQAFTPLSSTMSLHVARIDRDGNVVDPPRLVLDNAYVTRYSGASNGTRIAFFLGRNLVLLDATAHIISTVPIPIPEVGLQFPSMLTSNGTDFLAAWTASPFLGLNELDAVELDANGKALMPAKLVTAGLSNQWMALASNGSDYLLVYGSGGGYADVTIAHGTLATSGPHILGVPPGIPNETMLTWDGTSYVLSWTQALENQGSTQGIFTQRIDASGAPIDTTPFFLVQQTTSGQVSVFGVASNGRSLFYAWPAGDEPNLDIHGMLVDSATFRKGTETLVSQSANRQLRPAIAFSGRNYLVVWLEQDGLWGGRVSLDGRALDGRGFRITDAVTPYPPRVVFDGVHYLVAWEEQPSQSSNNGALMTDRIDADTGVAFDGLGRPAALNCAAPFDLASNGTESLAVFVDGCTNRDENLLALRIGTNGFAIGLPVAITQPPLRASDPSIAWGGGEWLVAFNELKLIPCSCLVSPPVYNPVPVNVDAVRLTPDLTVLDTQPIAIAGTGDENDPVALPHAASSGSDFLVTWTRTRKGFAEARRVSVAGVPGARGPIGDGDVTSTIWTGSVYASAYTSNDTILGSTIGLTSMTPRLFVIGPGDFAQLVNADGRITAAYQRFATEPIYGGVERVFIRDAHPAHAHTALR